MIYKLQLPFKSSRPNPGRREKIEKTRIEVLLSDLQVH